MPPGTQVITCDNPSPMTLEGTNTYLVGSVSADEVVIVDPGPQSHPSHLAAVRAAVGQRTVSAILVTHRHTDHTAAASSLSAQIGAPVRGLDPAMCVPVGDGTAVPLTDGEEVAAGGLAIEVLHTPGHTSDSACFWIPQAGAMITGDTVLGRGTTMLDFPDGTLADYLASLDRLDRYPEAVLLPAHGASQPRLGPVVARYRRHRMERLEQTRALLAEHGQLSAMQLAELVYGERLPVRAEVVEQIAAAQLHYLQTA